MKEVNPEKAIIHPLPEHYFMKPALAVPCIVSNPEQQWPRQQEYVQVVVSDHLDNTPILALPDCLKSEQKNFGMRYFIFISVCDLHASHYYY
jgi:hypothetical protein